MRREIICGIYKITSPTGRIYIGQSCDIYRRWVEYSRPSKKGYSHQPVLQHSFNKYGTQSHVWEIIEICEEGLINEREIYWVAFYNSYKKGMNCSIGGEGPGKGLKRSKETREKLSEARKGKWIGEKNPNYGNPSNYGGERHPFFGKKCPRITELNKSRIGQKLSAEHIEKVRQTSTGRLHSEEAKKKLTQSNKDTWAAILNSEEFNSEEQKNARSERTKRGYVTYRNRADYADKQKAAGDSIRASWAKLTASGYKMSEEQKATLSKIKKEYYAKIKQTPEYNSEENKKIRSDRQKAAWETRKRNILLRESNQKQNNVK